MWEEFLSVDGKPFLSSLYNLALKLNVDWIQPFDHTQYSMGFRYLVIENLPRSELYKVENVILAGCIPGPMIAWFYLHEHVFFFYNQP